MANNSWFSNLLPAIENVGTTVANTAQSNPIAKFLIGGAMNTAQDIGAGLGVATTPGTEQSANASFDLANKARQKAMTTTDPAEKQRLLTVAGNAYNTNASNAQGASQNYSPDVAENPLIRGLKTGVEVGTGADIAAHPIQTIKGTIGLAKGALSAVRHPIQTLDTVEKGVGQLPQIVNDALHNPMNFKLDKTPTGLNKLGNRWLLGQYKNADEVSRDPLGVVSTLKGYGLSNPQEIADSAKLITGKADDTQPLQAIVHKKVLSAVSQSDPVDVNGIINQTKNSIDDMTNVTDPQAQRALATVQRKIMNTTGLNIENNDMLNAELAKGGQAGLTDADPTKVLKATQDLDQLSHTAYSAAYDKQGNLVNPAQKELGDFYSQTSAQLKSRLFEGTTSDPNVTRMGANSVRLPNSWTPEEATTLNGIGNGKLGQDIMSSTDVPELRKYEALFAQGGRMADNVLTAGEKSPSLTQMATALSTAIHPNPIGPGVFLASTNAGKEMIGNTLGKIGDITAGAPSATLKGSIATQGVLNSPVVAENNKQNNNQSNPNQSLPPITNTSTTSSIAPTVNSVPTTQDQITFDQNGHVGVFNPFDGTNAITKQQYQDKLAALNATVKTAKSAMGNDFGNPSQLQKDTAIHDNALTDIDTLNALNAKSRSLDAPNSSAIALEGMHNTAADDIRNGWSNISLANGSLDKLATLDNGKYSKLASALKKLQDVSGQQIFVPGMSLDVAEANLQQATKTALWNTYYNQFPSQGGYNQLPQITGGTQTAPTNQLPPITAPTGQNSGTGVPHPFSY